MWNKQCQTFLFLYQNDWRLCSWTVDNLNLNLLSLIHIYVHLHRWSPKTYCWVCHCCDYLYYYIGRAGHHKTIKTTLSNDCLYNIIAWECSVVPCKSIVRVLALKATSISSLKVGKTKSCRGFTVRTSSMANRDFLSTVLVCIVNCVAVFILFFLVDFSILHQSSGKTYLSHIKRILGVDILLWPWLYEAFDRHESTLVATSMIINRIFEFLCDNWHLAPILRSTLASCDGQVFDHDLVGGSIFDHAATPVVEWGRATAFRLLMNLLLLNLYLSNFWLVHISD